MCSVTCKVGFYNKTHTTSQHADPAQPAAASSTAQPAEEPPANLAKAEEIIAKDSAANPDALQWKGVYCSIAEDASDILGTRGVVSVTATAAGLPKIDSAYSKETENDEKHYYAYDGQCEQEYNPNNVNV